jgi:hypothetical protein
VTLEAPAQHADVFVPIERFLQYDDVPFADYIRDLRAAGKRPVVSLELRVNDQTASAHFALSVLPGNRVQMRGISGGAGIFGEMFVGAPALFRDEVFENPDREVPAPRFEANRGASALVAMIDSLARVRRAAR